MVGLWTIRLLVQMHTYWVHFMFVRTLAKRLECSPMARETWVQSQVESYQRLKKWYLMPPCLTLSIIKYGSRVKLSNPEGVAPSPTPWCSSYRKGSPRVTLDYGRQLYFTSCSCAEDMTITNVIIKTPDRKCDWGLNDVLPVSDGLRIWWFWKKSSWGIRDAPRVCWFR